MLASVLIISSIGFGIWLGVRLVFGRATRTQYLAATVMPVLIGFLLMRFGNDAETLQSGQIELDGLPLLGFLCIMVGLLCGLTITLIGIAKGLGRASKRSRK